MTATNEAESSAVTITVDGCWRDGAVQGGEQLAVRRFSLSAPVTIGRDADNVVPLHRSDTRVSGLAAVLVSSDGDVKAYVTNRPGAILLQADGNTWRIDAATDRGKAADRPPILVRDGQVLWFPPQPLDPGREPPLEGGYWLELHLADASTNAVGRGLLGGPPVAPTSTDIRSRRRPAVGDLGLRTDQLVILTAVYAEYLVPPPGRLHSRPSTWAEVAAMVRDVREHRGSRTNLAALTPKTVESRVRTLVARLESQTRTAMPENPRSLGQRLVDWCGLHLDKSSFDVDLARRLLEARPTGRGEG